MGAPLLRVNGRDLSAYLQMGHEEGMEPVDGERITPEFSGSMALREGQGYVGESIGNREWTVPLLLSGASRAAVHQLAQDIQNDLVNGAQVEFAVDSATDSSSFFDLERGRLDVKFEYFLSVHSTTRATLHLWTRPHASTGTQRTVASFTGTGPQSFLATGIVGDRPSLADLEVRVGSSVASAGRVIGYAVHRNPSFNPIITASQMTQQTAASVFASATGIASTYLGVAVSPTGASGVAFQAFLSPVAAHVGRHRVLGVMRSRLDRSIPLYARDRFGALLGPTAQASQIDANKWGLVDLGEISVAARASGQEDIATQYINVYAGGAPGASVVGSYALQVAGLFLMNLDNSPGLLRTPGAGGLSTLYTETFSRFLGGGAGMKDLRSNPVADSGAAWSTLTATAPGWSFGIPYSLIGLPDGVAVPVIGAGLSVAGATGGAALASGTLNQDVQAEIQFGIYGLATAYASGASVDLWAKANTNASIVTDGVAVRLSFPSGLQTLQLISASGGATAVVASAGIATTLASGLWQGQNHRLVLQVQGPTARAWLATGPLPASSVLAANDPVFQKAGWPAVKSTIGGIASGLAWWDNLTVSALSGGASDIGPRQWFRFESHPAERAIQSNASAFVQDQTAYFRGAPPRLPVTGTAMPSGPVRVLVFEGEVDNFQGADAIDVNLATLERFQFLR